MTKRQLYTAGFIIGVIFIFLYLYLSLFKFECPTPGQYLALRIIISLGAGAFTAGITGVITVNRDAISAGGGLAVFVIVLLINPPALAGLDDCGSKKKISVKVTVFLDDVPFEFAIVGNSELEKESLTNGYGKCSFDMEAPLPAQIVFHVQSVDKAMGINKWVTVPSSESIRIDVARPVVLASVNPPAPSVVQPKRKTPGILFRSVKVVPAADTVSEKTAGKVLATPPPTTVTIAAIKNYCVACIARANGQIANQKERCNNDSLYLVNYISGFTQASKEQGREVQCEWKNTTIVPLDELKKEPLARVLVNFMQAYPGSCFNVARIRDWGGQKRGFKDLASYTYFQIEQMLEVLKHYDVVETGTCSNKDLYSFTDDTHVDVSGFLN